MIELIWYSRHVGGVLNSGSSPSPTIRRRVAVAATIGRSRSRSGAGTSGARSAPIARIDRRAASTWVGRSASASCSAASSASTTASAAAATTGRRRTVALAPFLFKISNLLVGSKVNKILIWFSGKKSVIYTKSQIEGNIYSIVWLVKWNAKNDLLLNPLKSNYIYNYNKQ